MTSLQLARGPLGPGLDRPGDDAVGDDEDHRRDASPRGRAALDLGHAARVALADAPGRACRFGKTLTLTGRAQGIKGALLQQRVDGVWTKVGGPG